MILELIRVALGKQLKLSHNPSQEEWKELFSETQKQSVVGIAFEGVQKLPKEQWQSQALLFEWIGVTEMIKQRVVIIPVGLLLGSAFKQMTWWKALLIGCSISITIEALQFWFLRGFSEVDDVMHNTVGCIIGYIIYSILVRIFINTKLKLDYA